MIQVLNPVYENVKSYYDKAIIDVDGEISKLYSYGTLVAEINDRQVRVFGLYSQTTLRHIKEFLKQSGYGTLTKKDIEEKYLV